MVLRAAQRFGSWSTMIIVVDILALWYHSSNIQIHQNQVQPFPSFLLSCLRRLLPGPRRGSLAFMLAEGVKYSSCWLKCLYFNLSEEPCLCWSTDWSQLEGIRRLVGQLPWQPRKPGAHQARSGRWLRLLAVLVGRDGQVGWMNNSHWMWMEIIESGLDNRYYG